jgi:hypothetical protein
MCVLAAVGLVPGLAEHLAAAVALAAGAGAVAVAAKSSDAVLHPRHVRELATVLPAPGPGRPEVVATSFGVQFSAGATGRIRHFTVTGRRRALRPEEAAQLASVIAWLCGVRAPVRIVSGAASTYHLLIEDPDDSHPRSDGTAGPEGAARPEAAQAGLVAENR